MQLECENLRSLQSMLENLHPWASKAPNERRFFLRSRMCSRCWVFGHVRQTSSCGCCLIQLSCMQHHFPSGLCLLQKAHCATLFLWAHVVCATQVNQPSIWEPPFVSARFIDRTSHDFSTASSAMPTWSDCFSLVLAPLAQGPSFFFSISLYLK